MSYLYVGVDVGKQHHHIAVVDDHGTLVSSERVANDQAHLQAVIKQICHRRRRQRSLSRLTPIEYETIMTPPASQAA